MDSADRAAIGRTLATYNAALNASDTTEGNQALFVLEEGADGLRRIARYRFSPTARGPA